MARTPGCSTSAAPTAEPDPPTMLTTPGGNPASIRVLTRLWVDNGVSVAGLITQVLPAISAGNSFQLGIAMGKFHGVMSPTTPSGPRMLMANLFGNSLGVVCPNRRRPSPAT